MGTFFTKFPEFLQKNRKIIICTDGITVDNDGISYNAVRDDPIYLMAKVQLFIVLQGQIRAVILAV